MRQRILINCAVAALSASFGTTILAGQTGGASQSKAAACPASEKGGKQTSQAQAPEGYVLLEEQTVYMMANEPQQHLLQAHADLARKNERGAAEETRLAAAYLDMQAARHGDAQCQDLKQQAEHLRTVARDLEQGKAKLSIDQLDRDFARASDALAKHFDALTQSDLQKNRFIAAGYDLGATANSFRNTIIWSDQKPSKDDLNMIRNAREIAFNLRGNDVYQGEKALKTEQKEWKKDENSKSADKTNGANEAQPANAKLPAGVTNSPLTGTTPAEARNDAEHAKDAANALAKAIDKCGTMLEQGKSASANHQSANQGTHSAAREETANSQSH